MKRTVCILFVLFCVIHVTAQQKKAKPYFLAQGAFLNGDHATSFQGMLTAGLSKKGWGLGIGAAVDYYKTRSVPLFIDIRRELNTKYLPLFAYTCLGTNLVPSALFQDIHASTHRAADGLYGEFGFGTRLYHRKKTSILLSAGYSIKTVIEKSTEIPYPGPGETTWRKLDYHFNRFAFRIGLRLW